MGNGLWPDHMSLIHSYVVNKWTMTPMQTVLVLIIPILFMGEQTEWKEMSWGLAEVWAYINTTVVIYGLHAHKCTQTVTPEHHHQLLVGSPPRSPSGEQFWGNLGFVWRRVYWRLKESVVWISSVCTNIVGKQHEHFYKAVDHASDLQRDKTLYIEVSSSVQHSF